MARVKRKKPAQVEISVPGFSEPATTDEQKLVKVPRKKATRVASFEVEQIRNEAARVLATTNVFPGGKYAWPLAEHDEERDGVIARINPRPGTSVEDVQKVIDRFATHHNVVAVKKLPVQRDKVAFEESPEELAIEGTPREVVMSMANKAVIDDKESLLSLCERGLARAGI